MNKLTMSAAALLTISVVTAGCGGSGSRHGAGEYPIYGPGSTGNIAKVGSSAAPGGTPGPGGGGGGTVGTFAAGPALTAARFDHTATTLTDGRVLVVGGGTSQGVLTTSEIFDPVTNTWAESTTNWPTGNQADGLMAVGQFNTARQGHTATLVPSTGAVIIAGGVGAERNGTNGQPVPEALKSAFRFDPQANRFVAIADLPVNRGYHLATFLPNGNVLVACGLNQSNSASLPSAEIYDVNANTWTTKSCDEHTYGVAFTTVTTPTSIVGLGVKMATNQQGQLAPSGLPAIRVEKFDTTANGFTSAPNNSSHKVYVAGNRISSGGAIIAGGIAFNAQGQGSISTETELFDPAANSWSAGPVLTTARQSAEMAELATTADQIVVAGLDGQGNVMANCEIYSAFNRAIVGTVDMQNARFLHRVVTLNDGRVMVIGGATDAQNLTETDSVEIHTR